MWSGEAPAKNLLPVKLLCYLHLALLHVMAFNTMPDAHLLAVSLTKGYFIMFDWATCSVFRQSDTQNARFLSLERDFERSIEAHSSYSMTDYLPLIVNYVAIEIVAGRLEVARCLCQRFLRQTPSLYELWILYASLEEVYA